jgi:predicted esterase
VIFSVWDYRDKPHLRVPDFDIVGVCARVIMSGDGQIYLELTQDEFDIKDVETKAHSFYEWVKENFKKCE